MNARIASSWPIVLGYVGIPGLEVLAVLRGQTIGMERVRPAGAGELVDDEPGHRRAPRIEA